MKFKDKDRVVRLIFIYFICILLGTVLGCGESGSSGEGDGNSDAPGVIETFTLTSSSDEIPAGGSASIIRVQIIDNAGNPVSNKEVNFKTTYGFFSLDGDKEWSDYTDANGIAEVTLTSDRLSGLALVTASLKDDGLSSQIGVKFVAGPPVNANSSITVQPSKIPADGSSTAQVVVTLADEQGNPVPDGTEIVLSASKGTITSENPTVITSGRASFEIKAPTTAGIGEVGLRDYPDIEKAELVFDALIPGDPASIQIEEVTTTEIAVTGVGRQDSTAVTVRIVDGTGVTVRNPDVSLGISFVAQPDGGEFLTGTAPDGNLVSHADAIVVDASEGEATFDLQSGLLPGVVEIQIEVLNSGTPLSPAVVTVIPQISIASGPPHTIALSAPNLNTVVDLNGGPDSGIPQTPGFYSRSAGLIVTDRYGNAVSDGTTVNLGVIDSVLSAGDFAEKTAGTAELTDATAAFDTAYVRRNGIIRGIEAQDRLVIFDAKTADKSRFVTTPIGVDSLSVTRNYTETEDFLSYAVGASLSGAAIYGIDGTNATKGTVKTTNGLAQLRLVYPANSGTIHLGAMPPGTDTRYDPPESARVITVFSCSNNVALVDEGTLVFSSIAGWKLEAKPTEMSGSGQVELTLIDGGDEIPLPFVSVVSNIVTEGTVSVSASGGATSTSGVFVSDVVVSGGGSGDTATISYSAGDAKAKVTVKLP